MGGGCSSEVVCVMFVSCMVCRWASGWMFKSSQARAFGLVFMSKCTGALSRIVDARTRCCLL